MPNPRKPRTFIPSKYTRYTVGNDLGDLYIYITLVQPRAFVQAVT